MWCQNLPGLVPRDPGSPQTRKVVPLVIAWQVGGEVVGKAPHHWARWRAVRGITGAPAAWHTQQSPPHPSSPQWQRLSHKAVYCLVCWFWCIRKRIGRNVLPIITKFKRRKLPRPERAHGLAVFAAVSFIIAAFIGNMKLNINAFYTFLQYMVPALIFIGIMLNRVMLIKVLIEIFFP